MKSVVLTEPEKQNGIDLSAFNHWSTSSLPAQVPRILLAGKVHAGERTTADIQARVFSNTLRGAAELIEHLTYSTYPHGTRIAAGVPVEQFRQVGRLVMEQIPASLREQVDEKLREHFRHVRDHTRGIATSTVEAAQRHAEIFRATILQFGGIDTARSVSFAGFKPRRASLHVVSIEGAAEHAEETHASDHSDH